MATEKKYPDTANASAASRILHDRLGEDSHLGPPEDLPDAAGDGSPALGLLRRWFTRPPATVPVEPLAKGTTSREP